MKTIGLTVGKFMPPHKGHELMIDFGASMLDEMVVIVGGKPSDEINVHQRAQWLADHYKHKDNVTILTFFDDIPMGEKDEYGTVIDEDFWEAWLTVFRGYCPSATHFVSSDMYGQVAAEKLGIKWLPVDPARETVPISATLIRNDPARNFNYIMDEAKPSFVSSVAIVGPESTGKSTLTKKLAEYYKTVGVHEYGRTVSETKSELTKDDFIDIMHGQEALINFGKKTSDCLMFTDSEAYTTYLYSKMYLGEYLEEIHECAKRQDFDLYLLMAPTVAWVDDGTRISPDQIERQQFFNKFEAFLIENDKPYTIIDATDHNSRWLQTLYAMNEIL